MPKEIKDLFRVWGVNLIIPIPYSHCKPKNPVKCSDSRKQIFCLPLWRSVKTLAKDWQRVFALFSHKISFLLSTFVLGDKGRHWQHGQLDFPTVFSKHLAWEKLLHLWKILHTWRALLKWIKPIFIFSSCTVAVSHLKAFKVSKCSHSEDVNTHFPHPHKREIFRTATGR